MKQVRRRIGATSLFTAVVILGAAALAGAAPYVAGELLVQTRAGVTKEKFNAVLGEHGAVTLDEVSQIRVKRIKVPPQALEKVRAALANNPHVNFVENNYLATGDAVPNDPLYASQWHLAKIAAPQGWDLSTGLSSVDIAVIDSGVDPAHPDLAGKLLPGYNFVSNSADTHDIYGHGTPVAGSAAAQGNNAVGVAGVAWQNQIMPLVALDSTNYASYSNIAKAITYAADHGVRVINISLGGTSSSTTLQSAVDYAWNKGSVIVCAAGNSNSTTPNYPAACNHAVAVSATSSSDTKSSYSTYGNWITVSAPGDSIYSTNNGGGYGAHSGTSFASPVTAGLAALILSVNPVLTNTQVVDILKQNADDLGTAGFDQQFGYGRINVYRSLTAAKTAVPQTDTTPPTVSITSPSTGVAVSGTVLVNVTASDNVGVAKVELYVNGTLFAANATAPYNFSWDSLAVADGACTLRTVAYDAAGNVSQSAQVTVTVSNVPDTVPPTAVISSPTEGSTVANKATIKASATDNKGVSKIELYIDSKLQTTVKTGSLSWNWNTRTIAKGVHTIQVKAFDAAGNVTSALRTVYK